MSTVFFDISAALDTQLNAMTGLPDVAWQNKKFTPTGGALFIRPTLIQGDTVVATLGSTGKDHQIGIYQIDIFSPSDEGKAEAYAMADTIADQFKTDTELTYNGQTVIIKNTSQKQAQNNDDGYFMLMIEVVYYSFTAKR